MSKKESKTELPPFDVVETLCSIEPDEKTWFHLSFQVGDIEKNPLFTFDEMNSVLNSCGFPLCQRDERVMKDKIEELSKKNEPILAYNDLGWGILEGSLIFKGHILLPEELNGRYIGNFDITPKGSLEGMKEDLKSIIIGHIELEFAFISGLTSSVVGLLKVLGVSINSIILNFWGNSGTGKTTAANLLTSTGGSIVPDIGKESLASDCLSTPNAFMATLDGDYAYPVRYDEIGAFSDSTELTQTVYAIANCKDKSRCDSNSKLAEKRSWATTVVFTGEESLLNHTKEKDGILARVINFSHVNWTASAQQARAVDKFSREHSGLPIFEFSKKLLKLCEYEANREKFISLFNEQTEKLSGSINLEGGHKDRMAKVAAIYKITANLAGKFFGVTFNTGKILDFLIEHINSVKTKVERLDLYQSFMEYIVENLAYFNAEEPTDLACNVQRSGQGCITNNDVKHPQRKLYGYIEYKYVGTDHKKAQYVIILKSKFREWHDNNKGKGNGLYKTLQEWFKKGLLEVNKNGRYITTLSKDDPYASMLAVSNSGSGIATYKIKCNFEEGTTFYKENPIMVTDGTTKRIIRSKDITVQDWLEEPDDEEANFDEGVNDTHSTKIVRLKKSVLRSKAELLPDEESPPIPLKGGDENDKVPDK